MRYVSEKYEKQLHELAGDLMRNKALGQVALTEPGLGLAAPAKEGEGYYLPPTEAA